MKKLRLRIIVLASWLALFFYAARHFETFAISNLTLGIVYGVVIVTLVLPHLVKVPLWAMLIVPVLALLASQSSSAGLMGYPVVLLALVEVGSVLITTCLTWLVSSALLDFEIAVAEITLGMPAKNLESSLSGQGSIYREVRRARNHKQPLGLISIGVDEKSIVPTADNLVQEIQRSMMKQYKLHRLSKVLCEQLEDCAVVVKDNDHYLAVLPDTQPDELQVIIERLRKITLGQVGVEIKVGVALLPLDGYTFEGLIEKATHVMELDGEFEPSIELEAYPAKNENRQ